MLKVSMLVNASDHGSMLDGTCQSIVPGIVHALPGAQCLAHEMHFMGPTAFDSTNVSFG
jgi:hypothetical protein